MTGDARDLELDYLRKRQALMEDELAALRTELREVRDGAHREPEPWVSVPEGAKRLGVSPKTLRRMIAAGEVNALRPEGVNVIRIPPSELTRLAGGT